MIKVFSVEFMLEHVPFTLDHIAVYTPTFQAPIPYYQHSHDSFELHYLSAGSCLLNCNGQQCELTAGNLILLPPHLYHRLFDYSENIHLTSISFHLHPPLPYERTTKSTQLYHCFQFNNLLNVCLSGIQHASLCQSIQQLADFAFSASETPFSYWVKLESFSRIFMADLFDLLLEQQSLSFSYDLPETSVVYTIDLFFNTNYNGKRTRDELARQINVSPRHLDRILHERYGMSFRERLNTVRLTTATELLTASEKSVAEISELLGYDSVSHFCTFIKRETGKTPTQIRKAAKK